MENSKTPKPLKKTMDSLLAQLQERQRKEEEHWNSLSEEEKQRIKDEEQKEKERLQREELIAQYRNKGIPPKFYDSYWNNWNIDTEEKKKAFDTVKEKAWKTNIFMCGKSGTGKTHLAMCLVKDGATYRRLPDIFREVRMNFSNEQEIIDHYGTTKYLIIDEVGRQKFSPFEMNLFFEIIDTRWLYEVPTTLITNQTQDEFFKEYGTAIIDRLRPIVIKFNWESYREPLNIQNKINYEDIEF